MERVIATVHVPNTRAQALFITICKVLISMYLDINHGRGQGYNRASNMSGRFKGLAALFLEKSHDEIQTLHGTLVEL
eukprot:2616973-Ditylum_brightwellii.AAC.1